MEEARRTAKGWNDPPSNEELNRNAPSQSTNHISSIRKYRNLQPQTFPSPSSMGPSTIPTTAMPEPGATTISSNTNHHLYNNYYPSQTLTQPPPVYSHQFQHSNQPYPFGGNPQ